MAEGPVETGRVPNRVTFANVIATGIAYAVEVGRKLAIHKSTRTSDSSSDEYAAIACWGHTPLPIALS